MKDINLAGLVISLSLLMKIYFFMYLNKPIEIYWLIFIILVNIIIDVILYIYGRKSYKDWYDNKKQIKPKSRDSDSKKF